MASALVPGSRSILNYNADSLSDGRDRKGSRTNPSSSAAFGPGVPSH